MIDDRAFAAGSELDPTPTPLIINDNLIDLLTTPTSPGQAAGFSWRPRVSTFQVASTVRTVAAGDATAIQVTTSPDGHHISVAGTIAAGSRARLRVAGVGDASAFGRTALIEALARGGHRRRPVGWAQPERQSARVLRGRPHGGCLRLPRLRRVREADPKVSHNLGANLALCLMAVHAGSHDCANGLPVEKAFLHGAGVDTDALSFLDGRGGDPVDRVTPVAVSQILDYWLRTPEAARFRNSLSILGVDGSLAGVCTSCPAKGPVFAKPGTVTGEDGLNGRIEIGAMTLGGHLEVGDGRYEVFYDGVTGTTAPDINGVIEILGDVADIAAFVQEDAAAPPPPR